MPSVTINEIDNTIVQSSVGLYNTTLVIGGSTFGPINTPTLLTSLSDLSIFGGSVEGTYSYKTAKNILRLGYPILFTRVAAEDESTATASVYGHKDIKDKSLTGFTVIDNENVNYGYKASNYGSPTSVSISTNDNNDIIVSATYDTAIADTTTFTSKLTIENASHQRQDVVVIGDPILNEEKTTATWTIPSGTSGYEAPDINDTDPHRFEFVSDFNVQGETDPVPGVNVDFAETEEESSVNIKAVYSGEFGDSISVDLYRTELAKANTNSQTNYQYSLKVYVGTGVVETFKIMQYPGKGYGPGESSLGETFDIAYAAALKQAVNGNSKYISVEDNSTEIKTSAFHSHLKEMDHLNLDDETQYELHLISLKGDSSKYGNEATIKSEVFKLCEDYNKTSPSPDNFFVGLEDKYTYDFRFATAAGICRDLEDSSTIPSVHTNTMDVYDAIRKLCYTRGDAFGILDIAQDVELTSGDLREYVPVRQYEYKPDSYVAYYCPWCYGPNVDGVGEWLPPSYWFLQALLTNVNNGGQVYNPPAGVKRMRIGSITATSSQIGGATLDELQSEDAYHIRINPIMNLRNYGYVVYGLRTGYALSPPYELSKKSALQQPHVRILANEIKAVIFDTALGLTFDNNNLLTWNSFISRVNDTLSSMQVNNALNDYEIIMDDSLQRDDRKVIYGSVKVSVFEAVEDFVIDFQLDPATVTYGESTVAL